MAPSYLRFPHLHGDSVVFVAEDDVWLAPVSGGRAYRLTADQVPAAAPRLSPDGQRLAWTTRREGAPEVYVADVEGGSARRLTYWGDYADPHHRLGRRGRGARDQRGRPADLSQHLGARAPGGWRAIPAVCRTARCPTSRSASRAPCCSVP